MQFRVKHHSISLDSVCEHMRSDYRRRYCVRIADESRGIDVQGLVHTILCSLGKSRHGYIGMLEVVGGLGHRVTENVGTK